VTDFLNQEPKMNETSVLHSMIPLAPSATTSVLVFFGYPLSQWLILLTFIYTCIMLFILVRDKIWNRVDRKNLTTLKRDDHREHPPLPVLLEEMAEAIEETIVKKEEE